MLGTGKSLIHVAGNLVTSRLVSYGFLAQAWWLGVFPGLFIMITVLSINFLGDALRDLLDVCEAKDLAHA